jgi:RNA polymerase sigma-70 factor (ECF subfamily)
VGRPPGGRNRLAAETASGARDENGDVPTPESHFARFRASGSAAALAAVFDALAPELLLVAAHLAPRGVEPEDVVQSTFLDAIVHAGRWDAARPLLPWLVGILVRNAQALGRSGRRRPDPARMSPRPAPETPLDASAAAELAEQVRAALSGLPRPYRRVLALHLVHGLSPAEIAHALGCPAATVRTRLHRGLERLRGLLPVGLAACVAGVLAGRGLAAVRQTVLAQAAGLRVPATAVALGTFGGVLLMTKLMVGAGAALAAAAVWMLWPRAALEDGPRTGEAAAAAASSAVASDAREEVAAPAIGVALAPSPAARSPTTGALRVELVWAEDSAPAGPLLVRTARVAGDREADVRWDDADHAGVLDLPSLVPGRHRVQVFAEAPAEADVVAGESVSLRVALEPRLDLRGVVVTGAGTPVPGAEVRAQGRNDARVLAVSGVDGSFRWRGDRVFEIWAQREGWLPSEVVHGGEGRLDRRLVLGDGAVPLRGRVIDPDGAPVPGALVVLSTVTRTVEAGAPREQGRGPVTLRTDEGGAFSTTSQAAGEQLAVALAEGHGPAVATLVIAPGGSDIALRLTRGSTVWGTVTRDGTPCPGVFLSALPGVSPRSIAPMYSVLWASAKSDDRGRYQLSGLLAGSVRLLAQARGLPSVEHALTLEDGEAAEWNPDFVEGPVLRGTVQDERGAPLRGWHVYTRDLGAARSAVTDERGRFALEGLQPGFQHDLQAAPPTAAGPASTLPWVQARASAGGDSVVLTVAAAAESGAFLTGTVVDLVGQAPLRATVNVYSGLPSDTRVWRQPVAADGRFTIGPLPPRRYQVRVELADGRRASFRPHPTATAGQTPRARRADVRGAGDVHGVPAPCRRCARARGTARAGGSRRRRPDRVVHAPARRHMAVRPGATGRLHPARLGRDLRHPRARGRRRRRRVSARRAHRGSGHARALRAAPAAHDRAARAGDVPHAVRRTASPALLRAPRGRPRQRGHPDLRPRARRVPRRGVRLPLADSGQARLHRANAPHRAPGGRPRPRRCEVATWCSAPLRVGTTW